MTVIQDLFNKVLKQFETFEDLMAYVKEHDVPLPMTEPEMLLYFMRVKHGKAWIEYHFEDGHSISEADELERTEARTFLLLDVARMRHIMSTVNTEHALKILKLLANEIEGAQIDFIAADEIAKDVDMTPLSEFMYGTGFQN